MSRNPFVCQVYFDLTRTKNRIGDQREYWVAIPSYVRSISMGNMTNTRKEAKRVAIPSYVRSISINLMTVC